MKAEVDEVVISIEKMLREVSQKNPECFIYQVPKGHRKMNESAFTPQVISIGPYHYGRPELKAAEEYKLWALNKYLSRVNMSVQEAMNKTLSWEQKARSCYGHHIQMNKQEFARMMLLDGCFILEFTTLMWKTKLPHLLREGRVDDQDRDYTYYFLTMTGISSDLLLDLTMVENQLPFFVILQLFKLICTEDTLSETQDVLIRQFAILFYHEMSVRYSFHSDVMSVEYSFDYHKMNKVRHTVDLVRMYFIPSAGTEEYKKFHENEIENQHIYIIPQITFICQSGLKVEAADEAHSLMDLSFKDGILKIPPLRIDSNFEIHIQNLIVSEMLQATPTMVMPPMYSIIFHS